jgi:hypothetical protein
MEFANVKKIVIPEGEVKQIDCNGVMLWKGGYTNLVPTSIDTDGSIYNGTGYIDGYRLSSSGNISSQSYTMTTGFIKCVSTDLIRMSGLSFKTIDAAYNYVCFYDASFTLLGSFNIYKDTAISTGYRLTPRGIVYCSNVTLPSITNGIITFDNYTFKSDADKVAYVRINGQWENGSGKSGADMIVTINEEIE